MFRFFASLLAIGVIVGVTPSFAQENTSDCADVPTVSYDPMTYDMEDCEENVFKRTWIRPKEVQFVWVLGCGGGGGGYAGSAVEGVNIEGGLGGKAAPYTSYLVGPLSADVYTITLGQGGKRGRSTGRTMREAPKRGGESKFEGGGLKIVFPGGRPAADTGNPDDKESDSYRGLAGEDGPFGVGTGGPATVPFQTIHPGHPYSGLGRQNGSPGRLCAGGGGSGGDMSKKQKNSSYGGRGGHGRVVVIPRIVYTQAEVDALIQAVTTRMQVAFGRQIEELENKIAELQEKQ